MPRSTLGVWSWKFLKDAVSVDSRPPSWQACRVTYRQEATRALYEGSLADVGDANPYSGQSLVLAKLWMRGYMRMLRVRIDTGPAMQRHRDAIAEN